MDGELPPREPETSQDRQPKDEEAEVDQGSEGRSQLDYLQRLVGQIQDLQWRLQGEKEGEIKAIGVMGTDVYDKLLVLRARRPSFEAQRQRSPPWRCVACSALWTCGYASTRTIGD